MLIILLKKYLHVLNFLTKKKNYLGTIYGATYSMGLVQKRKNLPDKIFNWRR